MSAYQSIKIISKQNTAVAAIFIHNNTPFYYWTQVSRASVDMFLCGQQKPLITLMSNLIERRSESVQIPINQ